MIRTKELVEPEVYRADEIAAVSSQNIYRQLDELITDWAPLAAPLYAAFCTDRGRPTDPIVYYKIFLIAYLENICFDTDLAERIDDSRAIRRFLHYNLLEQTPDHSTIGEVRGLLAAHGVTPEPLLAPVLAQCLAAGLVGGAEVAVDSTLEPANASLKSLVSRSTGQHVQDYLRGVPVAPAEPTVGMAAQATPSTDSPATPKPKTVSNTEFRSTTDPDARLAIKPGFLRDMYDRITHLTDGRSLIILAVDADHTDVGEVASACPVVLAGAAQLAVHGRRFGLVCADTGYDDAHFHAFIEEMGGTPVTFYNEDTSGKDPAFQKACFTYDPLTNTYRCPEGKLVRYKCQEPARFRQRYVSSADDCAACPKREACLDPKSQQRWLSRHEAEESRERNKATCHTAAGRAALQQRKYIVEPPFGHLKAYGGLPLVNCRGLGKVRLKAAFGALAWNLIQLVNHARRQVTAQSFAHNARNYVGLWTLSPRRQATMRAWLPRCYGQGVKTM